MTTQPVAPSSEIPSFEGIAEFIHAGRAYATWYKVFGQFPNKKSQTPVVVLHGGFGFVCDYIMNCQDLAKSGRPVIFYDQIGNGRSAHVHDQPKSFWTWDLIVDQLVNLITHLGIEDKFDLLGHSWGGMLGAEFELRRQPQGLRRLILTNSLADYAMWQKVDAEQVSKFPQDVQDALRAGPDADREKFMDAMSKFIAVHVCTVQPLPSEFLYSLAQSLGENSDRIAAAATCVNSVAFDASL